MKWLLVSNDQNPGDIWVRFGIEKLIKFIDSTASFLHRKRDTITGDPVGLDLRVPATDFDFVVICGMPLLCSFSEYDDNQLYTTIKHPFWKHFCGWLSDGGKMIVAAFGLYLPCPEGIEKFIFEQKETLISAFQTDLFQKCKAVYSRSPIAKKFWPKIGFLPCPSIFAPENHEVRPDLKLCNLMPGGAAHPKMSRSASARFNAIIPSLSEKLKRNGFRFMAHSEAEFELAKSLNWPDSAIHRFDGNAAKFLEIYTHCFQYFGNRIHGGIISRSVGANVITVGYDLRIADVEAMGGQVYTPSQLPDLTSWFAGCEPGKSFDRESAWKQTISFWKSALKL